MVPVVPLCSTQH